MQQNDAEKRMQQLQAETAALMPEHALLRSRFYDWYSAEMALILTGVCALICWVVELIAHSVLIGFLIAFSVLAAASAAWFVALSVYRVKHRTRFEELSNRLDALQAELDTLKTELDGGQQAASSMDSASAAESHANIAGSDGGRADVSVYGENAIGGGRPSAADENAPGMDDQLPFDRSN